MSRARKRAARAGAGLPPFLFAALAFGLAAVCGACGGSGGGNRSWTVLVYMAADNDLASAASADLAEMTEQGSTDQVAVVVQVDQPGAPTRRYRVEKGALALLEDLGEQDMAAPQTLTDFVAWGAAFFPAKRTALILWNHGNGWDQGDGPSPPAARAAFSLLHELGGDNGSPFLSNSAVRAAVERAGAKPDLLGLDASIMGTIEALYEFRGLAPVLVTSQELGEVHGWDYRAILAGLGADPAMGAERLAELIVASYGRFLEEEFYPPRPNYDRHHGIAAHRTAGLEAIAEAVDALAERWTAALASEPEQTVAAVAAARAAAQPIDLYSQPHVYADLAALASRLDASSPIPALIEAATIAEYHGAGRPGARGVSIVFFRLPEARDLGTYDSNYRDYHVATNTGNGGEFITRFRWDEFLEAYYAAAGLL